MRRPQKTTLAIALAMVAIIAGAAPAAGHDELVMSSPGAGEVIATPPTTVSMVFSAEIMTDGAVVAVTSPDGDEWVAEAPEVAGYELTTDLTGPLPEGDYEVRWRVVSSDGHPISGVYVFTVGAPSDQSTPAVAAPTTSDVSPPSSASDSPSDGSVVWGPLWSTAAAGAVILGALLVIRVLKRRPKAPGEPSSGRE